MPGNINWNLYKYFTAVYETRNLHRAGDRFNVSHSAVLQNLNKLSEQLGVTLFNSDRRGVIPTPSADALYEKIKSATQILDDSEAQFCNLPADGKVTFLVQSWFARHYINDYITQFRTRFPSVELKIIQGEDLELLTQNKVDFILGMDVIFEGADFKIIDLDKKVNLDESAFAASKDFLAKRGIGAPISVAELVKLPLVEQKSGYMKYWKHTGAPAFREIIDTNSYSTALEMVRAGNGITCMNHLTLRENPDLVPIRIRDFAFPPCGLAIAYNSVLSRPAKNFVSGFMEFLKSV